jgi:hypothetical protein
VDKLQTTDKLPRYIQVHSTLEFTRLVCALERAPRVSFLHDYNGKKILSVQMDVLKEKPIVYYTDLEHNGHYLCYGMKGGKEESEIVDTTSDASKLYSPIYQPIQLEDMSSLAKLTWGIEEMPFPLFLFPHNDKWLIGVFMNFNDEGTSYFCHVVLDSDPQKPFLKFTTANSSQPAFVENPSEHGFSYIKIIKLKDTHPLVDYGHLQN